MAKSQGRDLNGERETGQGFSWRISRLAWWRVLGEKMLRDQSSIEPVPATEYEDRDLDRGHPCEQVAWSG